MRYLDQLATILVMRRPPPWQENPSKRQVPVPQGELP